MKTEFNDPNCDIVTLLNAKGTELKKFEHVKIAPPVEIWIYAKIDGVRHEVIGAMASAGPSSQSTKRNRKGIPAALAHWSMVHR